MSMLDEDTRRLVIQKTWCHGQVLAPVYGILCLIWFSSEGNPWLLYAGILLPVWCYVSYRSVFVDFSPRQLVIGGILVEIAYVAVFSLTIPNVKRGNSSYGQQGGGAAFYMLLCIASALFAVETFAFLVVALTLHRQRAGEYRDMTVALPSGPTIR